MRKFWIVPSMIALSMTHAGFVIGTCVPLAFSARAYGQMNETPVPMATVKYGGKFRFIDQAGRDIFNKQFDGAGGFSEGLAAVKVDGKWAFISAEGVTVIKPQFDAVGDFRAGLAPMSAGGKWGFIDKNGWVAISPVFSDVQNFSCGLAPVRVGDRYGYIDRNGITIIPTNYEYGIRPRIL